MNPNAEGALQIGLLKAELDWFRGRCRALPVAVLFDSLDAIS